MGEDCWSILDDGHQRNQIFQRSFWSKIHFIVRIMYEESQESSYKHL